MATIQQLEEADRRTRISVADGLDVLFRHTSFTEKSSAVLSVGGLRLPSGEIVGLVDLVFDDSRCETKFIVSLATSKTFLARLASALSPERFSIFELDEAVVKETDVVLSSGRALRSVQMVPALLPNELSSLELDVLHCVISMLGIESECYVHPSRKTEPELLAIARELKLLDFGALPGREVPLLKLIRFEMEKLFPDQIPPSEQTISNALAKAGMRRPAQRQRTLA